MTHPKGYHDMNFQIKFNQNVKVAADVAKVVALLQLEQTHK